MLHVSWGAHPHHAERPHQGKVLLFLSTHTNQQPERPRQYRERFGGLLKYYYGSTLCTPLLQALYPLDNVPAADV